MGQDKKQQKEDGTQTAPGAAQVPPRQQVLAPIAKPLAEDKLRKKVLKLAKKATKRKSTKRGVKEVIKALRKQPDGCGHGLAGSLPSTVAASPGRAVYFMARSDARWHS